MGLPCRNEARENVSCIGTNSYLHGDGRERHMGVVKKSGVGGVDSGDRLGC